MTTPFYWSTAAPEVLLKLKWKKEDGIWRAGPFVIYQSVNGQWPVLAEGKRIGAGATLRTAKVTAQTHANAAALFGARPVKVKVSK